MKIKRVICGCTNREMTKIGKNEYFCNNCNCRVNIEFDKNVDIESLTDEELKQEFFICKREIECRKGEPK